MNKNIFTSMAAIFLFAGSLAAAEPQMPPPLTVGGLNTATVTKAPLHLTQSATLMASPDEIFAVISDHNQWVQLLGAVTGVTVERDGKVGSTRVFRLDSDVSISERVVAINEPAKG